MTMKRALLFALLVLAALAAAGYANREALILTGYGAMAEKRALEDQIALIEPSICVGDVPAMRLTTRACVLGWMNCTLWSRGMLKRV